MRTPALTRVGRHGFKRFEIGMNVTENGEPHLIPVRPPEKSECYNGSTRAHQRFGARIEFCDGYRARDLVIDPLNVWSTDQEFVGPAESRVCLRGTSAA